MRKTRNKGHSSTIKFQEHTKSPKWRSSLYHKVSGTYEKPGERKTKNNNNKKKKTKKQANLGHNQNLKRYIFVLPYTLDLFKTDGKALKWSLYGTRETVYAKGISFVFELQAQMS